MIIVHMFVSHAHVNLCHFFSSSWCRGLAAASACGSSWTFPFTFSIYPVKDERYDLLLFYANVKPIVIQFLQSRLSQQHSETCYLSTQV